MKPSPLSFLYYAELIDPVWEDASSDFYLFFYVSIGGKSFSWYLVGSSFESSKCFVCFPILAISSA